MKKYYLGFITATLCLACINAVSAGNKIPKCPSDFDPSQTSAIITNAGSVDAKLAIRGKTKCKGQTIEDVTGIDFKTFTSVTRTNLVAGLYTFCMEYSNTSGTLVHKETQAKVEDKTETTLSINHADKGEEIPGACFSKDENNGNGGSKPNKPKGGKGKKGKNKVPPCPGNGRGRTDLTILNRGTEVTDTVLTSTKLSCTEDSFNDAVESNIAIGFHDTIKDLAPGLYQVCYSYNAGSKQIQNKVFNIKKHKIEKLRLTGTETGVDFDTVDLELAPSAELKRAKRGGCTREAGITTGIYEGRGTVTKGACASGNMTFTVSDNNTISGTLIDDNNLDFKITGKYNPKTGAVRGKYTNSVFKKGRFSGVIDADKGVGKFSNAGAGFRCSGELDIVKQ